MDRIYDRKGNPICIDAWERLRPEEAVVRQDKVGDYWVSTVWLGFNHNYGQGPPLIFETMVFKFHPNGSVDYHDLDSRRYSTEEEALKGHSEIVEMWELGRQLT